jgi:hypothetical protein
MSAADFTGLTGAQGVLQDFSKGNLQSGDMRMFDLLGLGAGAAPVARTALKGGGLLGKEALRQMNEGTGLLGKVAIDPRMYAVTKTDYEKAFDLAQKRAALPVEEGGLGLPANNTAMDRAKAMGYTSPTYHGTNADFNIFNVEGKGKTSGGGAFVTDNPVVAESYVGGIGSGGNIMPLLVRKDNLLDVNARGRNWADIWTDQLSAKSKGKKYSLDDLGLDRYSATTTDELAQIAPELGLKGASIKNVRDLGPNSHIFRGKEYLLNKYGIIPDETWSNVTGKQFDEARKYMDKFYKSQKSNITALQKPYDIRSVNAAFDPFRRNEGDILAGLGVGVPSINFLDKEKPKKKK